MLDPDSYTVCDYDKAIMIVKNGELEFYAMPKTIVRQCRMVSEDMLKLDEISDIEECTCGEIEKCDRCKACAALNLISEIASEAIAQM